MILAETTNVVPGADIVVSPLAWALLVGFIIALIVGDLLLFHREEHEIVFREAAISTAVWIAIGLAFGIGVWVFLGGPAAGQYYTAYLIEKSLSVDNVFVWAVLLGYFAVPKSLQHRVLFWGVFGALVLRAIFIFAGVALLNRLEWLVFVFGAFLVFTGARVAFHDDEEVHPEHNPVLRFARKHITITKDFHGKHFFIIEAGKRVATPLFAVLLLVEVTDVVFAVDSIPAVLAVSRSQFIVFSSNAFALLGLRALFFMLYGMRDRLVYLNVGLGLILGFVGLKMLGERWVHVPTWLSLTFIVVVLTVTVLASLRATVGIPIPEPDDRPEFAPDELDAAGADEEPG